MKSSPKRFARKFKLAKRGRANCKGSEELNAYIAAIRTLADSSTERFKFYWNHLEHANETIAEDSSKEVAFAMHEYWNTGERPFDFKLFADLNQVRLWLKDVHVPEHRRRVYLRLLGIVGSDEDTEVLKRTISNGVRENPNSNLQAQIEACVLLGGPAAWDFVEQKILQDDRSIPDTSIYSMIRAVRFLDMHSKVVPRDRLLQSLHLMLDRPALADIPNGVLTFKEGRAEISFEGLETGEYTLRFQRVMDLQLDDDGLPRGVSRHGVPSDVSLPVKFDSSQDNLPIYWGKPVAGLRIGAMFLDSRKDHMRSFKPRDQAASQLFVQNVGSKEVECGFDPPYHSGGWGMEIADNVGQRISGVWKDEPRSVGVLIPPSPMWARLAPNEIQPISGEFTKFRVRDDDYGGTTHYEHAKFTIVAEKPEELRALPPHHYLMPTGEYNALFSATLRKAESPDATFALESGPCPFRVGADGTTSTQDEEDVQWGPAGQNGLQAGVRFNPSQTTYVVGQPIKLEFFFRTVDGRSLEGSLPNVFDFDGVEACDTTGESIPALHTPSEVVGGWMSVHFSDKPMSRTYEKFTIVAETNDELKNAENLASAISSDSSVVRAHPGTDCRVRFTVHNFANGADGTLQTGEVAFRVNEALKGSNPAN